MEIDDGTFIYLEDVMIHSKRKDIFDPYNFILNYTLDQENNRITFYIPDDQPNNASARFYATASVYQERTPGGDRFMSDELKISGYIKNASVTIDLGFYKQMG